MILTFFGLFLITDILSGRLGSLILIYVVLGALVLSSYLSYIGRQKSLTPWWQIVVVSPLAISSIFLFEKPIGWVFPALFLLLGFVAVFAVHWDRKRGRRA